MSNRLFPKHSCWVRWTHWLNFPIIALMVWSGIRIYWANDVYPPFFPEWFYQRFDIHHRLAHGMAVHFLVMWFLGVNGAIYLIHATLSGHWRHVLPDRQAFREAPAVVAADLGLGKAPVQRGKYNAAQRIAYTAVILMGVGSILSGLAIYKPTQLTWIRYLLGGYENSRLIHFILAMSYSLFFLIHVTQVLRAGWNNLRSMIAGFEVKKGTD